LILKNWPETVTAAPAFEKQQSRSICTSRNLQAPAFIIYFKTKL
jgi:hypothetical protein